MIRISERSHEVIGAFTAGLVQRPDGARQPRFGLGQALGGGAVPEPATWAMMLMGFGALGTVLRQQRRRGVATA